MNTVLKNAKIVTFAVMSEDQNFSDDTNENDEATVPMSDAVSLNGLYENWFLDYASYVILDRAVPHINDGLKPVQRRILHSLEELDDGRLIKVANVIGNTMKYHPHGDASIGDAMVQLGQKGLLIDTQGNWGDPITGDSAAAPRYIEARLSKFAHEVLFNSDVTEWQSSYDGRNQEPVTLPAKFPLLLAQGAEGIAVGLATKIMPHNFIELIDSSILVLKGGRPNILPDFQSGGMADFSNYNEGLRGGRIRVRSRIVERDKKTLVVEEIPFSTTTDSLKESIIAANNKGKIKIKKIEDYTSNNKVEIVIQLAPGISPDVTIDALYAFTQCEVSIAPNTCVIKNDKPYFMSVNDVLIENTHFTKEILKRELEIKLRELMEKIFFSTLLKIFIQEGMYKNTKYENAQDFEEIVEQLNILFEPFFPQFYREITPEDYKKLIDKPMSSITRFDVKKADAQMKAWADEVKEIKHHLKHLTEFAIAYFENIKRKYSAGKERKTEIRFFDKVEAAKVALANVKLYIDRQGGFVGTGLKKDEFLCDCSDLDDIIIFREDGKYLVTKVADKTFVGKDIIHGGIFVKNDARMVYNVIYKDGQTGVSYYKRFSVTGITRDKEYDLTKGSKGSKVLYFTANPNGEAEVVNIQLRPQPKLKKIGFDVNFAEITIKGKNSNGNQITKYPIKKVVQKSKGVSTHAGRKIWFDDVLRRLNVDNRGKYLGAFDGEDKILLVYADGTYEFSTFELTNHFEEESVLMVKYVDHQVFAVIHFDGKSKHYFVKRFTFENAAIGKRTSFISEENGSKLIAITSNPKAVAMVDVLKGKTQIEETIEVQISAIIDVKGMRANGNRLSLYPIEKVQIIEPEIEQEPPADKNENKADIGISGENIKLEITNPDDIESSGGHQMKLF